MRCNAHHISLTDMVRLAGTDFLAARTYALENAVFIGLPGARRKKTFVDQSTGFGRRFR